MHPNVIPVLVVVGAAVAAAWVWVMFLGGAQSISRGRYLMPLSPAMVKVFSTGWLLFMACLLIRAVCTRLSIGGAELRTATIVALFGLAIAMGIAFVVLLPRNRSGKQ